MTPNRLILSILLALAASVFSADWPLLRGPNNDGISSAKLALLDEPERLWRAQTGKGNGGVVVENGLALVYATGQQNLTCLNAETGETLWSKGNLSEWHGNHTPSLKDGRVYIQSYQLEKNPPKARCLDAKTGDIVWETQLPLTGGKRPWGMAGSALILGDVVYFNAGGGVALNAANGEAIWQHDGWPGLATPVLFQHRGKDAIAFFLGDRLLARDKQTGAGLWSISWPTSSAVNACRPTFIDGKVLINSGYGLSPAFFDVSGDSPKEIWRQDSGGHAFAASILHDGVVYGFFRGGLACMNPADGSLRWREGGNGSVLLIGGQLVWVTEKGELKIAPVSKDGFEPTLIAQVHGGITRNNPAYVDGKIFLKNERGEVVCWRIAR